MRYMTDRKRAEGRGASHTGTEHHWSMQASGAALALMVPTWIYVFGHALGSTRQEVLETFGRPFPAILTAMVLVVAMRHFAKGATMMLEDYTHGSTRRLCVALVWSLAGITASTGLYALVKMAI